MISMIKQHRWLLVCACAIVIGFTAIIWVNLPPTVNQAQARAIEPAIATYMQKNAAQFGIGGVLDSRLKPQVFCDANILQITADGARYRVGMIMNCAEYARRGSSLIEGSMGDFTSVCEVMLLARSRTYQVLWLDPGPAGYDPAWVHENFSSRVASWILSTEPPTAPDPVNQARQAFGFPAGTVAIQD